MGWTIGGGFEAMLTSNLSGFIEGRYSDYGSATYTYGAGLDNDGSGSYVTKLTDTAIRTGINFHF
jgi:opacity protein-like surface antigen